MPVGLAGVGGLGSQVAQQLAYLGIKRYVLVDREPIDDCNLNRLIGATTDDLGALKVYVTARTIRSIQPDAEIAAIPHHLPHIEADRALNDVDLILGGVDDDAARLQLIDLASRKRIVYIDAASDTYEIGGALGYGGRVVTSGTTPGCPFCFQLLDQNDIRRASMTPQQHAAEAAIYGVPVEKLQTTGPSVVTINGVVASLATTEAMVHLTGLRKLIKHLNYYGDHGNVRPNIDPPSPNCPYCARWLHQA